MKSVTDNENNRRKRNAKNKERKEQRGDACSSESVRAQSFFFCAFKSFFLMTLSEMNTSRKVMEWLTCFSIVNLLLGCFLFKKFKKLNESCSLSKAARMS